MKRGLLQLLHVIAFICFSQSSMAALLDLTNQGHIGSKVGDTYQGTFNGIGFTLSSNVGSVNFDQNYDGNLNNPGCQAGGGALFCTRNGLDGAGIDIGNSSIDPDEINGIDAPGNQILTLTFDRVVKISGFYFLDLYTSQHGTEQATVTVNGIKYTVDATETAGVGGYADLMINPVLTQTLEFSADFAQQFWEDGDNDYALAGVNVSAVPLPPAIWLFGSAMAGLIGFRRKV